MLLVERHVTRSADKLGISQPAMSASLARLRALFHDQLLVRGPKGLVLTPRAEQVLEQLNQAMAVIEQVVAQPAEFVAETSHRTFNLVGTDFCAPARAPSQKETLRRDCLDHVVIFGARHLWRVLTAYSRYYNQTRTHLRLDKDAPLGRSIQRRREIIAVPVLSGLHHCYSRI